MSEKQFPPAQALRAVPLEAAHRLAQLHFISPYTSSDLRAVIQFVEQFRPKEAPDMVVAGGLSEIQITDPNVDEEQINLVRLNGRVFSPEVIEVDAGEAPDDVVELVNELRQWPASKKDALSSAVVSELMQRAASALVDNFAKELDEDDLEQIISDSLDMDWKPRDAARAIHAELYGKGEE